MSGFRDQWTKRYRMIALGGLSLVVLGLVNVLLFRMFAPQDEPAANDTVDRPAPAPAPAPAAKKAAEGEENVMMGNEMLASVKPQSRALRTKPKLRPKAELPSRPSKVVTRPDLTPQALDRLIDKHLAAAEVAKAWPTTDGEFIRRVTLDLTGTVPASDEFWAFVQSKGSGKRAQLIDTLLDSRAFAENLAHYWREVIQFHVFSTDPKELGYLLDFDDGLATQIENKRSWDEIVHDMITATGRDDENGAVALSLAQDCQAAETAGEVARVFLGVQIQCAQCHDHPTDSWKRQQFHEFAAFFAGCRQDRFMTGLYQVNPVKGVPDYVMPDKAHPEEPIPVDPRFFLATDAPSVPGTSGSSSTSSTASIRPLPTRTSSGRFPGHCT